MLLRMTRTEEMFQLREAGVRWIAGHVHEVAPTISLWVERRTPGNFSHILYNVKLIIGYHLA